MKELFPKLRILIWKIHDRKRGRANDKKQRRCLGGNPRFFQGVFFSFCLSFFCSFLFVLFLFPAMRTMHERSVGEGNLYLVLVHLVHIFFIFVSLFFKKKIFFCFPFLLFWEMHTILTRLTPLI